MSKIIEIDGKKIKVSLDENGNPVAEIAPKLKPGVYAAEEVAMMGNIGDVVWVKLKVSEVDFSDNYEILLVENEYGSFWVSADEKILITESDND